MSQFTTPAILEMLDHYRWRVHEPFAFYLSDDSSDVISVPAGFVTDLATVPRIFWTLLPPDGKYAKAAIIHDYLYDNALRTKQETDKIFPGRHDGAWRAEVETYCDVLGGEVVRAGNVLSLCSNIGT